MRAVLAPLLWMLLLFGAVAGQAVDRPAVAAAGHVASSSVADPGADQRVDLIAERAAAQRSGSRLADDDGLAGPQADASMPRRRQAWQPAAAGAAPAKATAARYQARAPPAG